MGTKAKVKLAWRRPTNLNELWEAESPLGGRYVIKMVGAYRTGATRYDVYLTGASWHSAWLGQVKTSDGAKRIAAAHANRAAAPRVGGKLRHASGLERSYLRPFATYCAKCHKHIGGSEHAWKAPGSGDKYVCNACGSASTGGGKKRKAALSSPSCYCGHMRPWHTPRCTMPGCFCYGFVPDTREGRGGKKRHGREQGPEYVAHFDPQAWINDYAVSADPEGDTDWNATAYIRTLSAEKQADIARDTLGGGDWMDDDDVLARDPRRPRWVQEWSGPFTITVRRAKRSGGKKRHATPKRKTGLAKSIAEVRGLLK